MNNKSMIGNPWVKKLTLISIAVLVTAFIASFAAAKTYAANSVNDIPDLRVGTPESGNGYMWDGVSKLVLYGVDWTDQIELPNGVPEATIVLNGYNKMTTRTKGYAIMANGSLNIEGSGTLEIFNDIESTRHSQGIYSYGFKMNGGTLILNDCDLDSGYGSCVIEDGYIEMKGLSCIGCNNYVQNGGFVEAQFYKTTNFAARWYPIQGAHGVTFNGGYCKIISEDTYISAINTFEYYKVVNNGAVIYIKGNKTNIYGISKDYDHKKGITVIDLEEVESSGKPFSSGSNSTVSLASGYSLFYADSKGSDYKKKTGNSFKPDDLANYKRVVIAKNCYTDAYSTSTTYKEASVFANDSSDKTFDDCYIEIRFNNSNVKCKNLTVQNGASCFINALQKYKTADPTLYVTDTIKVSGNLVTESGSPDSAIYTKKIEGYGNIIGINSYSEGTRSYGEGICIDDTVDVTSTKELNLYGILDRKTDFYTYGYGIYFNGTSEMTIKNCNIYAIAKDAKSTGLYSAKKITFENSKITAIALGPNFEYARACEFAVDSNEDALLLVNSQASMVGMNNFASFEGKQDSIIYVDDNSSFAYYSGSNRNIKFAFDYDTSKMCILSRYNFASPRTNPSNMTGGNKVYYLTNLESFTVTYESGDYGKNPAPGTAFFGMHATKPGDPTDASAVFIKWCKNSECTQEWNFNNDEVFEDITLYALWGHKITFDKNIPLDESPKIVNGFPSDKIVEKGKKASSPTAPTLVHYTFDGWYEDSSCSGNKWDFSSRTVTQNVTLYAKWTPKKYTVAFNKNGHGSNVASQSLDYNTVVTEPTKLTENGWTFVGWFTDTALKNEWNFKYDKVNADTTLYAKWTQNDYTVTYDANGHGIAPKDTKKYHYGDKLDSKTAPTEAGYTFGGWFTTEACSGTAWDFDASTVADNVTLYAKWTAIDYTLTYNMKSHGTQITDSNKYHYGDTLTKPTDPSETGWTFEGWYTDDACTSEWNFKYDTVKDNTVLYAKWQEKGYKLTYDANGHGIAPVDSTVYHYANEITKPADPIESGYTFDGWYKEKTCANKWKFKGETGADKFGEADITLYARWIPIEYTAEFNLNGVTPTSWTAPSNTYHYEDKIARPSPEPSKEGYAFGGWYKDSSCSDGNEWYFQYDTLTSEVLDMTNNKITLYAKWTQNEYNVTYIVNGHGTPPAQEKLHFNDIIASAPSISVAGWTLEGWYTDPGFASTSKWVFGTGGTQITDNITLYANWQQNNYTVTYHDNDRGTTTASATNQHYGDKITKPADPSVTGYTFVGWYRSASCDEGDDWDFRSYTMPEQNLDLYAKWKKNEYKVTFDAKGHGTNPAQQTVKYNEKAAEPTTGNVEGYTLAGWYTDSSFADTAKWNFNTDSVTQNMTLYAKWIIETYTVDFNMMGHGTQVSSQTIEYDKKVSKPADPSQAGCIFDGWYSDSACKYRWNFDSDSIKQNTTIYAKWIVEGYTVSFEMQGHGGAVLPATCGYEETIAEPSPVPNEAGQTFGGWYKEVACVNAWDFANDKVTSDMTLYAKWTQITCTVTFDMMGYGTQIAPITGVIYDSKIAAPENPSYSGYSFLGWCKDSACSSTWSFGTDKVTEDITLYAKWDVKKYNVIFDNNGIGMDVPVQNIVLNGTVKEPSAMRENGYDFEGWYSDDGTFLNKWDFENGTVSSDMTLYAKWTQLSYSVTFDAKGHGTAPDAQTKHYGDNVSKPTDLKEEGLVFEGWYSNAALTKAWDFEYDVVTKDLILYAKWNVETYNVSFEMNGHGSEILPIAVEKNMMFNAPNTPTEDGFAFKGWYKDAEFSKKWNFTEDTVTGPVTLYALWESATYTVNFVMNGHGKTPEDQTLSYNDLVKKPANPSEKEYVFGGWFKDATCELAWDFDNDRITDDLVLYAKWTGNSATVTFDVKGKGKAPAPIKTELGKKISAPSKPEEENFTFAGWYKDKDLKNEWRFDRDVVNCDITLYAKWDKNTIKQDLDKTAVVTYTVKFSENGHGSPTTSVTVPAGEHLKEPSAPSDANYVFDGWYKDAACRNKWSFSNDTVRADITLYAKWNVLDVVPGTTYVAVSYDQNGHGEAPSPEVGIVYGKTSEEPEKPEADGWIFDGWYTEPECINEWSFDNQVTENIVLYAKWSKQNYKQPGDSLPEVIENTSGDKEYYEIHQDTEETLDAEENQGFIAEHKWLLLGICGGIMLVGGIMLTLMSIPYRKEE